MPRYLVVRTDRRHATFIARELEAGRLRQGWGYLPEQDLRAIRVKMSARAPLTDAASAAWRNRRLLDTEPDGVKPGDTIIIPNIPTQGRWAVVRVSGAYRYEPPPADAGVGADFAHILPVDPVRGPNGELAVIEADNEHVHARLRASMRNMSRMWSVDSFGDEIEALVGAITRGADTTRPQPEAEKFAALASAAAASLWEDIQRRYKGAELEHLVVRVFERIYHHGDAGRVEHWGGAGEKGADLIVYTRSPRARVQDRRAGEDARWRA